MGVFSKLLFAEQRYANSAFSNFNRLLIKLILISLFQLSINKMRRSYSLKQSVVTELSHDVNLNKNLMLI